MKTKFLAMLFILCLIFSIVLYPAEKIVFHSDRGGSMDIWMCNPDGTEQQQLTNKSGSELYGRLSSDGKEFLYTYTEPGSSTRSMWVMALDGSYDYKIDVGKDAKSTCWSPNGDKILYFHNRGYWRGDIYLVNKDGTGDYLFLAPFSPFTQVNGLDWKNGKILFYASRSHSGLNRLFTINEDGTDITQLTDDHGDLARFNHDASKISYFHHSSINIMNADGSGKYTVISGVHRTGWAPFSPDGTRLTFAGFTHDLHNNDIYIINIDGTNLERITFSEDTYFVGDWIEIESCVFGPEGQPMCFVRKKGKPGPEFFEWESCGGSGKMVIQNQSISSALIFLNGEQVAGPSDFSQTVNILELDINLFEGNNLLEVELRGKPGGELLIRFEN